MTDTVEVPGEQGPEVDELQQLETAGPETYPPLCVTVDGPVNTRDLPAVDCQIISRTLVTGAGAVKLVGTNNQRSRITLVTDNDIYLARTKTEADANVGKIPAAAGAIPLRAPVEYWAKAAAAADAVVTLILDEWAH